MCATSAAACCSRAGENVYGEQGYSDTAVEKVLPVQFRAQEKRKDLALVIALDRSYSMKGRKMELAKEATRAALDLLEEQHQFRRWWLSTRRPTSRCRCSTCDPKRKAEDQISRIQASGQTNIYPALGIVYRMLQEDRCQGQARDPAVRRRYTPGGFRRPAQTHDRRKDRGVDGGGRRGRRPDADGATSPSGARAALMRP